MEDSLTATARIRRFLRHDPSALSLILSNLATIVIALVQGWELAVLMRIYWAQSVIIGPVSYTHLRAHET